MDLGEVIRARRASLGLSQADLAERAGVDKRQVRRYEAGEAQPTLSVGREIAEALGITLDELAGADSRRIGLTGSWWAAWQTSRDGVEVRTLQPVTIRQRGDLIQMAAVDRGNVDLEGGGYLWRGELRLWDNEILMGWYAAVDEAVRSKGTLFLTIHANGQVMTGRWVGLSWDEPINLGCAAVAKSEAVAVQQLEQQMDLDHV